jgi:hypothetical protein
MGLLGMMTRQVFIPLDFKQISWLAEGTQSPSPLAAEEATSHASKTRLDGKTQSLLP